jgi:hypothetical protein
MSSALTELDIRSAIATALTGLLGTYRYSNGATEPAFKATDGRYQAAGHPWQFGPEVPKVTGLEAVLEVDVDAPEMQQLMGKDYWIYRRCRLTLKQHDITASVRPASRALVSALNSIAVNRLTVGPRVSRDARLDNIETQAFTFLYPTED